MLISVVINTLNEERDIADCIKSVAGLADEVIVCDMHSNDDTVKIASACGARIVHHERTGYVEPARHFAISQANGTWVLVLDADERMCSPLKEKLLQIAENDQYDVVSFWSLYWFFGSWIYHGGFFNGNWSRFFRKCAYLDSYSNNEERVHENFRNVQQHGNILHLPNTYLITHYAYPTVEKYIHKTLGNYARIEAEQLYDTGQKFSFFRMLWDPAREGVGRYIMRQGYKDGTRGLILACLYAGFRFSMWANLWFLTINANQVPKSKATTEETG